MIQRADLEERRDELSDFLRTRRARLSPADVGLIDGPRRRTPGLRREEVALLANIGSTWYTRLEQGLPINVSSDVLESISRALRLTPAERRHLYVLAGQAEPEREYTDGDEIVSDVLRRTLEALNPNPAYIRSRRWDLLAYNQAWRSALCYDPVNADGRNNMLWSFFTKPESRERHPQWEAIGPRVVAQFRSVAARYPDDPAFRTLIAALQERSEHFRRWWAQHDVAEVCEGMKHFFHEDVGEMILDHTTLIVPDFPDMRLVVFSAEPNSESERRLHRLVARELVAV